MSKITQDAVRRHNRRRERNIGANVGNRSDRPTSCCSRILRYFLRRGATPELAADLTAEVFAAALAGAGSFNSEGPAVAWLYGIARNTLAASRRQGRVEARARVRLGMAPVELSDDSLDRIVALEAEASASAALDGLSALERAAVEARVLEERDYRDIAAELSCSEAVVRQRVSRGLTRLRRQLERRRT